MIPGQPIFLKSPQNYQVLKTIIQLLFPNFPNHLPNTISRGGKYESKGAMVLNQLNRGGRYESKGALVLNQLNISVSEWQAKVSVSEWQAKG